MKFSNFLIVIMWLLTGVAACSGSKDRAEEEQNVETLLPETGNGVTVETLQLSDFNHELVSNGKLASGKSADLHFESAEPLAAVWVKNGDWVTQGQKLAELASFRLSNKAFQAKDALDRARLEMQDVLIGQGYTPADSAQTPPATLQLARTRSGYDQALAQYELAAYEEQRAVLTAPFDGTVANLFAKPFNMASTSEAFCTIIDTRNLEVSFTVLEGEASLIQVGDNVKVTPFSLPDGRTEGRISEINPIVDENGMVRVKASVANPGKRLLDGMNVRIHIQRLVGKQLVVPKEAVVLRSGKQVVFTFVEGKAYWNYVQTGLENAGSYTITEGLKEGDIIITSGNINLAHESAVSVL
ncbi:MAG: efflux RND transporter periplasmic adaptor subunit [Tannerellaceae bacterium]|jgi:RND family efflux transporter MFP subunit|nr:efflux RND transporter periplasmic adaptor subunit [Tannerellaceae bacterium]